MLLKEALTIAEDFGEIVMKFKEEMKIINVLLYGSVAYNKENPNDIDIMLIHYNTILDNFLAVSKTGKIPVTEKIDCLQRSLGEKISLRKELENRISGQAIINKKLHVKYLNESYFSNQEYKEWWKKIDESFHKNSIPKNRLPNESFLDAVFRQGFLFNEQTKKYDIKADF